MLALIAPASSAMGFEHQNTMGYREKYEVF